MAERRMFSKSIIDSDEFIDMPLSTQALYFHLSMRADDDGFINNSKKIIRMIGASNDEMKVLIAKQFIIPFESGIIVIKHWKIHNYIRKDRNKETLHLEEKSKLNVEANGSYSIEISTKNEVVNQLSTNCQPNVSIGKDRLGKDRLGKDRLGKDRLDIYAKPTTDDLKSFIDAYNGICTELPKCTKLTDTRKQKIKKFLGEFTQEEIKTILQNVKESDFLSGRKTDWKANFDWIINKANSTKILEGNYKNNENDNPLKDDWESVYDNIMQEQAEKENINRNNVERKKLNGF